MSSGQRREKRERKWRRERADSKREDWAQRVSEEKRGESVAGRDERLLNTGLTSS